jgi:hypothetical protein
MTSISMMIDDISIEQVAFSVLIIFKSSPIGHFLLHNNIIEKCHLICLHG